MAKKATNPKAVMKSKSSDVLRAPRITERAALVAERGAYVFDVAVTANKKDIARAIATQYKVTPVKVNVVNIRSKNVVSRGKRGKTARGRKAYVFLKKGDTLKLA